ncbi:MAG: FeoB-associated Cys-rich membrane protein [Deltaproteobacteria bacterium]|nr:FeoB-associated Cys-rich membrane protein [Deltaproteobacteria bacterium]
MGETIVVILIVATVAVLAGRSLYRTLAHKNQDCGCGSGSCSLSGECRRFSKEERPETENCV